MQDSPTIPTGPMAVSPIANDNPQADVDMVDYLSDGSDAPPKNIRRTTVQIAYLNQDTIRKGLYSFVKLHTFRRIKFPTTEKKGMQEFTKAVEKSYVQLPEGVDTDVFAHEWQSSLRERLRMLRNNCQNSAKRKFIGEYSFCWVLLV